MDWKPGKPPLDKEGHYLVYLSKPWWGSYIMTVSVRQAANGFIAVIGTSFYNDFVDDDLFVLAWCDQPDGPGGTKSS